MPDDLEAEPCQTHQPPRRAEHAQALYAEVGEDLRAKAESQRIGDFSPLWSGQNDVGCREAPAAEITRALAAGL